MLNLEQVRQFLYYEARLLDDRQWDEWLSCYSPQVVYWMPAWGDAKRDFAYLLPQPRRAGGSRLPH